jgi:hypothetical protein
LAAEAKLGALVHNSQDGLILRQTLPNLSHPQTKTLVHCDNAMAIGIANKMVKCQCLQSIEMRFFWIGDKIAQDIYDVSWHLGQSKSCGLSKQVPHWDSPQSRPFLVLAPSRLPLVLTVGS